MPKIDFHSVLVYIGVVLLIVILIWLFTIKFIETARGHADVQMYEKPTWIEESEGDK